MIRGEKVVILFCATRLNLQLGTEAKVSTKINIENLLTHQCQAKQAMCVITMYFVALVCYLTT